MADSVATRRTPLRRKAWWIALIGAGPLAVLILAAAAYDALPTQQVTVVDTGSTGIRMSGCMDDALDLWPGQRSPVEAPRFSKAGCLVYVNQNYVGCLVLRARDASPINVLARLDRQQSERGCEQVG